MSSCGNVQKVFVPVKKEETEAKKEEIKSVTGVNMTEKAAEKIHHFCTVDKKDPTEYGLKVSVTTDGCSGKSYVMDLAPIKDAQENGDKFYTLNGATMIIDKLSYMFVIGSTLDYVETLLMSGFQLVNPNVKKTCSCGSSFAV